MSIINLPIQISSKLIVEILIIFLMGFLLHLLFIFQKSKTSISELIESINNADLLLQNKSLDDALLEYNRILEIIPKNESPEIYKNVLSNRGLCYYYLAIKISS